MDCKQLTLCFTKLLTLMLGTGHYSFKKIVHKLQLSVNECKFNDITDDAASSPKDILASAFLKPFKTKTFYYVHDTEFFDKVKDFFDGRVSLEQMAEVLALRVSKDPIELILFEIEGLVIEDEVVRAIGVFQIENQDKYLFFNPLVDGMALELRRGIPLGKFDKGCLIFDTEREQGFKAIVVDESSKSEAQHWRQHTLGLTRRKDDFYKTQQVLQVCREFVEQTLEVPAEEVALIKGKAKDYFYQNQTFDKQEFEQQVFEKPEVVEAFEVFAQHLEQEKNIAIEPQFEIVEQAVKKDKKTFRSVIKLDKNFHVYVHSNPELLEKGFDPQRGLNYYRLFFNREESK